MFRIWKKVKGKNVCYLIKLIRLKLNCFLLAGNNFFCQDFFFKKKKKSLGLLRKHSEALSYYLDLDSENCGFSFKR